MTVIGQPWARVKQPTAIPRDVDRELLLGLPVEQLAVLLRDHLVPSGAGGPDREAWDAFWALLREDDELAERAFDVLEDFLDDTEDALEHLGVDDPQVRRMRKFHLNAKNAWARLQKDEPQPQRASAAALHRLIGAIVEHRRAVQAAGCGRAVDDQLWRVLGEVRLDPTAPRRQR